MYTTRSEHLLNEQYSLFGRPQYDFCLLRGFTKYCSFPCLRDSKERNQFIPGENNTKHKLFTNQEQNYFTPLFIKSGFMKNSTKLMDNEEMIYISEYIFPNINGSKLKNKFLLGLRRGNC